MSNFSSGDSWDDYEESSSNEQPSLNEQQSSNHNDDSESDKKHEIQGYNTEPTAFKYYTDLRVYKQDFKFYQRVKKHSMDPRMGPHKLLYFQKISYNDINFYFSEHPQAEMMIGGYKPNDITYLWANYYSWILLKHQKEQKISYDSMKQWLEGLKKLLGQIISGKSNKAKLRLEHELLFGEVVLERNQSLYNHEYDSDYDDEDESDDEDTKEVAKKMHQEIQDWATDNPLGDFKPNIMVVDLLTTTGGLELLKHVMDLQQREEEEEKTVAWQNEGGLHIEYNQKTKKRNRKQNPPHRKTKKSDQYSRQRNRNKDAAKTKRKLRNRHTD